MPDVAVSTYGSLILFKDHVLTSGNDMFGELWSSLSTNLSFHKLEVGGSHVICRKDFTYIYSVNGDNGGMTSLTAGQIAGIMCGVSAVIMVVAITLIVWYCKMKGGQYQKLSDEINGAVGKVELPKVINDRDED